MADNTEPNGSWSPDQPTYIRQFWDHSRSQLSIRISVREKLSDIALVQAQDREDRFYPDWASISVAGRVREVTVSNLR